jgi:glycosyltransferase involved in cell wall biosynthesis
MSGVGGLSRIAVIIPAYDPGAELLRLCEELLQYDFAALVVVDDGSQASSVFEALSALPRVQLLHHAINAGKGRALKTAFNHCLLQSERLVGVVTADADGQHRSSDIVHLASQLLREEVQHEGRLVLGVREFHGDVPLRSRFGNTLTRGVFRLLYGLDLQDTQTGLRAIPLVLLPALLDVEGERYEYESSMLIAVNADRRRIEQVAIATVYENDNRSSHFSVIRDSMKIYFVLLRFLLSSLLTSAIDFVVFSIAYAASDELALAMVWGRGIAQSFNFLVNLRLVFRLRRGGVGIFIKYLALVVLLGLLSYLLIGELQQWLGLSTLAAKLLAESVLFVLSFSVQRELVFTSRNAGREGRS